METYLCLCVASHLAQRLFTIMEKCFQFVYVSCCLGSATTLTHREAEVAVAALRLMMRKWNGSNNIPIHTRAHPLPKTSSANTTKKEEEETKQNKSYARETCDAGAQISVMVAATAAVAAVDKLARMSITMHMCVRSMSVCVSRFAYLSFFLSVCRALKCMKSMHDFSRNHTIVRSDDGDSSSSSLPQPHNHFRHEDEKKCAYEHWIRSKCELFTMYDSAIRCLGFAATQPLHGTAHRFENVNCFRCAQVPEQKIEMKKRKTQNRISCELLLLVCNVCAQIWKNQLYANQNLFFFLFVHLLFQFRLLPFSCVSLRVAANSAA